MISFPLSGQFRLPAASAFKLRRRVRFRCPKQQRLGQDEPALPDSEPDFAASEQLGRGGLRRRVLLHDDVTSCVKLSGVVSDVERESKQTVHRSGENHLSVVTSSSCHHDASFRLSNDIFQRKKCLIFLHARWLIKVFCLHWPFCVVPKSVIFDLPRNIWTAAAARLQLYDRRNGKERRAV